MKKDTFVILKHTKIAQDNKPVDAEITVARVVADFVERMFMINDERDSLIVTVEAEIFITDQPNLTISTKDCYIRQISNNKRWRIIKAFNRSDALVLWVAASD